MFAVLGINGESPKWFGLLSIGGLGSSLVEVSVVKSSEMCKYFHLKLTL
jgi:hypothetical protein